RHGGDGGGGGGHPAADTGRGAPVGAGDARPGGADRFRQGGGAGAAGRAARAMMDAPLEYLGQIFLVASVWVLPVLLAVTFHEAAHGYVAWRLGDSTAKTLGRVTFNPLRHVDPVGTILLPGLLLLLRAPFLFGYAKPVPVNFSRLGNPRRDMVFVAAAGPGANIILAFLAALMLHLVPFLPETVAYWTSENLQNAIW